MEEQDKKCQHEWFIAQDGTYICGYCKSRMDPKTKKILPPSKKSIIPFTADSQDD